MKNIINIMIALSLFAFVSCSVDDSAKIPLVELGVRQNEYILEADGGEIDMEILSNGKYHIEYVSDAPWLTLASMDGNGDGQIRASVEMNEEFKRMVAIVLCSDVDERKDTVYIKQKGMLEARLEMSNTSVVLDGKGGESLTDITTNIPFEYMEVQTVYNGDETGWIESLTIEAADENSARRSLKIGVSANTDKTKVRMASVLMSYEDGWGEVSELLINLVQKNADELLGVVTPFYNIRYDYSTGTPVEDYIILEGVVVSNTENGNAGENEQSTTSSIDYDGSKKTVNMALPFLQRPCQTTFSSSLTGFRYFCMEQKWSLMKIRSVMKSGV